MSTDGGKYPFNDRWDAGQVGWIYATKQQILDCFQAKRLTKKLLERARKVLVAEVEAYDKYLRGDVWCYIVRDEDGECQESCGGYNTEEEAQEEGEAVLKQVQERLEKEAA
jgi:hypothetical protein